MAFADEIDPAEHRYWREFCPACGVSPCEWDGRPDGEHTRFTEAQLDAMADKITIDLLLLTFGLLNISAPGCNLAYVLVVTDEDAFAPDGALATRGDSR